MKHREVIGVFSLSVFFIYYFVAILFSISGLPSLGYLIFFLGVVMGFAMVGLG